VDVAIHRAGTGERLVGEMMPLQMEPGALDVVQLERVFR
jgi:hypothetical protein